MAPNMTLAVISTTAAGKTSAGARISVADRPVSVGVTLARAQVNVKGFARNGSAPASGVMIVLVPSDPRDFPALVRRDQSDSDGSFELRGAAPGSYALVAIQDGWNLDWQRPDVIARYLRAGIPVNIPDQSGPELVLPQAVPVQQRMP
jgi:hypothetical protein